MDIYFIRQFLEKDDVVTAISYTGIEHASHFIYILLKYFDFDITNYSYLGKDMGQVKQIIKNKDIFEGIARLIYPPILKQCSNLESFEDPYNLV